MKWGCFLGKDILKLAMKMTQEWERLNRAKAVKPLTPFIGGCGCNGSHKWQMNFTPRDGPAICHEWPGDAQSNRKALLCQHLSFHVPCRISWVLSFSFPFKVLASLSFFAALIQSYLILCFLELQFLDPKSSSLASTVSEFKLVNRSLILGDTGKK